MASAQSIKLGPVLKELRLHLCQKSVESKGIREFIKKYYVPLKKNNPQFPILIRECSGVTPKVFARYDFGKETSTVLSNYDSEQVLKTVQQLAATK